MIELLSFLFASGVGFGLACLIFGTLLDRSNNIGDSRGGVSDYKAYVSFTARKDRLNKEERGSFCSMYAKRIDDPSTEPKPFERVRRLTDEEIAEYRRAAEEKQASQLAREKDRAVEHAQDDGRAVEVLEIVIDALRYGVDGLLQPLVGDVGYEVPVFDENPAFHLLDDLICENTHYLFHWQTESSRVSLRPASDALRVRFPPPSAIWGVFEDGTAKFPPPSSIWG